MSLETPEKNIEHQNEHLVFQVCALHSHEVKILWHYGVLLSFVFNPRCLLSTKPMLFLTARFCVNLKNDMVVFFPSFDTLRNRSYLRAEQNRHSNDCM